jgi:phage-related minor tail protein
MANLAKEGVTDLAGAFKSLVNEIKDAPAYADSVRLSIKAFGAQAGPKLAEEIRGGTYSVEELATTLDKLKNTTENTAKASESFSENLGTLKNQMTLALAPIGIEMINSFKKLMPVIKETIEWIAKMVELFSP